MKKLNKILFGLFLISTLISSFTVYNVQTVVASSPDEKVDIPDGTETHQAWVPAGEEVRFKFDRTKITVVSNENINLTISCDASEIGDKDFQLDLEVQNGLKLDINCKEEKNSINLQLGDTIVTRDGGRYKYQEGFVVEIDPDDDDDVEEGTLRIEETDENRGGTWAYYDDAKEEWVTEETTSEDGYLVCKTDHFSTWTILVPEIDITMLMIIGIGIGAIILLGVTIVIIRKRRS